MTMNTVINVLFAAVVATILYLMGSGYVSFVNDLFSAFQTP